MFDFCTRILVRRSPLTAASGGLGFPFGSPAEKMPHFWPFPLSEHKSLCLSFLLLRSWSCQYHSARYFHDFQGRRNGSSDLSKGRSHVLIDLTDSEAVCHDQTLFGGHFPLHFPLPTSRNAAPAAASRNRNNLLPFGVYSGFK